MKFKKFCNRVVIPIIGLLSLSVILSFPFLSNKLNHLFAVICFVCSLVIFPIIVLTSNSKNRKIDIVTMILVYYIFGGIFVINYFNTPFNWLWFIFGLIIIGIPFSLFFINYWYKLKNKPTKEQKLNFKQNVVKYTLFYYAIDLFYMSFIIDNLICRYIFGGIIIIYIFYNSTKVFINNIKPRILSIIHDVFIGLGITIYLIFIIPNDDLRNVVTSIVSAVFGGYVTLLGVAWTIKDNSRNRKEDERQYKIPYLYLSKEKSNICFESFDNKLFETMQNITKSVKCSFIIEQVTLKVSRNSDCIPIGFILNDCFFKLNNKHLLERGTIFNLEITKRIELFSMYSVQSLYLVCMDTINNYYKYECELKILNDDIQYIDNDNKILRYNYIINDVKLPKLIRKEDCEIMS